MVVVQSTLQHVDTVATGWDGPFMANFLLDRLFLVTFASMKYFNFRLVDERTWEKNYEIICIISIPTRYVQHSGIPKALEYALIIG